MLFVWLLVMLALSADGSFRFDLPQKCEKISIPHCRRVLPYNLTRFPNAVGDQNQALANRSIELYRSLVQRANCSKHAMFFMCSFYLPICLPGIEEEKVIKPCRSLCKQIRADCAEVIPVEAWQKVVKCEELPEYSDNVCIQPDSFIAVSKPSRIEYSSIGERLKWWNHVAIQMKPVKQRYHAEESVNRNSCEDRPPADYNSYAMERYDYVIKFKAILIERLENHNTIIRGRVSRVFRQNNVTISKGRVKIWSNTDLTCSSLVTGKVFLICGHENAPKQKLLLSSTSLIEAWSGQTLRNIRLWERLEKKVSSKKGAKNVSNM